MNDICKPCISDLPWLNNSCIYCAVPIKPVIGDDVERYSICADCQRKRPIYSAVLAGFEYRYPVDYLVNSFKDHHNFAAGHLLTQLALLNVIAQLPTIEGTEVVVPVPSHWKTRRRRGFNQAEFIGREVARKLNLKFMQPLRRNRETSPQKQLSKRDRQTNLQQAFGVTSQLRHRIFLIDDVVTTGATAETLSNLLMDAGAEDVIVLALARTPSAGRLPV